MGGMIPEKKIVEIRERSSIVEVVSDYLTLRKVGRNYLGLCPFHAEKTPSFTVNEEKAIFHCFGCGIGGNVFHFLMQLDQSTFPEAVERVAKRYGIPVERLEGPGQVKVRSDRESLYRLNESVAKFLREFLLDQPEGKKALTYLKSRGIEEEVAERFRLGYAPQSGHALVGFLKRGGYSLKDAARLGLIHDKGSQQYGEKFFGRLIFPIMDPVGKIIGFGGRVLGEGFPKYLNSSETPLFRKGASLYGLFQAKEAIRKLDRVVVVEGYLDVMALSQAGLHYAVATLGTALTPDHVRILGRYTKNVIALFDGDDAGRKAAARSFEIFIEGGLLGRAAFLPRGEDPDTFVRSKGREALEEIVERAIPLADYYCSWLEERYGRSLEAKSQIAQEISRILAKVGNPVEADLLARRAADLLGITEGLLRVSARSGKGQERSVSRSVPPGSRAGETREDLADRSLVGLMLRFPSLTSRVDLDPQIEELVAPKWKEMVKRILTQWREHGTVDIDRLAYGLPVEHASEIAALVLEAEVIPEEESEKMADDCLSYLQRRYLRRLEKDLRLAIRAAEERQDEKAKRERMLEWQEVVQRERQLERQRLASKTGNL